ncbi:MAG: sulfite exporter TauE/SafE family protein [Ignavibacteria bacterium]|nr:MAG: sulfite exporter TauE/SafE family protein [Ignavibacteria bacterium]
MENIFIILILILFLASFVQGLSGFGFQLVALPLLSIFINIKEAIPLAALCGYMVNIYLIISLRQHIKIFTLKRLIAGAVVGIPIGAYFLASADPVLVEHILGVFIVGFVALNYFKIIKQINLNVNWGYLFGLVSGLLGGAFNTNGPPIIIYFYLQGMNKEELKASITGYFIFTSTLIVLSHLISGVATIDTYITFVKTIPFVLLGIVSGNYIFKRINTGVYNFVILIILFLLGISLLFR